MLSKQTITEILKKFGLAFTDITKEVDTSHGDNDRRLNYILDNKYVLKVHSVRSMWELRLQEIQRLIDRYRSIGVYCPRMILTLDGTLSCLHEINGISHTCFVEEFAIYPVCPDELTLDRKEVLSHVGKMAAKYSGVDLSPIRSMWSIIDLAPLDVDVDEKQENTNLLCDALKAVGYPDLAAKVNILNEQMRAVIVKDYLALPRCVYQGDMNSSNELHKDGHFVGLIDFNMAGTDVNINVFANETNWFPDEAEFDNMPVDEILRRIDAEQAELLEGILENYTMNELERRLFPYYKRIADVFQWPIVCSFKKWLKEDSQKEKCIALIQALVEKPFAEFAL